MPSAVRRIRALLLLALLSLAPGCSYYLTRGLEQDWVRVANEHHVLNSTLPADETLELFRALALFRAAVLDVTHMRGVPDQRTEIYVFDERSWEEFGHRVAGIFLPGRRANIIVISESEHPTLLRETLFHEYAHFLVGEGRVVDFPLWYGEGWAELLGSFRDRGAMLTIGEVSLGSWHWLEFPWLPFRDILSTRMHPDRPHDMSMLYAQSWALVHYLQLGRDDPEPFRLRLRRYLDAIAQGVEPIAAFTSAFELDVDALDAIVPAYATDYRQMPVRRIPRARLAPVDQPAAVEPLTEADVAVLLGRLHVNLGDSGVAVDYLGRALALDPDRAETHALLGRAWAREGAFERAEAHLSRAVALAPAQLAHRVDRAWVRYAAALEQGEGAHVAPVCDGWADLNQEHPGEVSVLSGLGACRLCQPGREEDALRWLEAAHARWPANPVLGLFLGRANLAVARDSDAAERRVGHREAAQDLLRPVHALAPTERLHLEAGELLAYAEAGDWSAPLPERRVR